MRRIGSLAALGVLSAVATACGDAPRAAGWSSVAQGSLSAPQRAQEARAQEARQAMFDALFARLSKAVAEGGPARAIPVCRDEAPQVARDVAREKGVAIGRTSHRLRDPKNAPPPWAAEAVATRADAPRLFAHGDGRLGVLLPIRLQKGCLACHGAKEALDPEVAAALHGAYPADEATGFAEGDLRGWFWVEVPKP